MLSREVCVVNVVVCGGWVCRQEAFSILNPVIFG